MGLFRKKDGSGPSLFGKIFSTVAGIAGTVLPVPGLDKVTETISTAINTPKNQPGPQLGRTDSVPVNAINTSGVMTMPSTDGTGILNIPANNQTAPGAGVNITTVILIGLAALFLLKKK